jgi:RimJ/RimL family protein N-acetyltransferase
MSIAPLETARLRIRDFEIGDLETYHRLKAEAFDDDGPLEATQSWLDWTVRNYRELEALYQPPYGDYVITVKDSGAFIGAVGIAQALVPWNVLRDEAPKDEWIGQPEFGLYWAMFKDYQGQGYATEAAQAVIDYVFDNLHAACIVATTEHDNAASQAVMRKLGMTLLRNPGREPAWAQVCGVLENPKV